ncbi:MAG: hypothetical protein ACLTER_11055 [Ruminococcus sp.]
MKLLRLSLDEELIILRGQKALKAQKFDFTLHPESQEARKKRKLPAIFPQAGKRRGNRRNRLCAQRPQSSGARQERKSRHFLRQENCLPNPTLDLLPHENPEDNFMEESTWKTMTF